MKRFGGFPPKLRFTSIPEPFFSHLLPEINDIAELKVILYIVHLLYNKKGYPKYITLDELSKNTGLMTGLSSDVSSAEVILKQSLLKAEDRGIILLLDIESASIKNKIVLLNSESDRELYARLRNGDINLPELAATNKNTITIPQKAIDIYSLYEQNIGMITPIIAEEISQAQRVYPVSWLQEAIREAANQNKRKWSYISAILERWNSEGKASGTYRGDTKKTDPDKYIKGKYGHMVQR